MKKNEEKCRKAKGSEHKLQPLPPGALRLLCRLLRHREGQEQEEEEEEKEEEGGAEQEQDDHPREA